jgi:hypothetical protein
LTNLRELSIDLSISDTLSSKISLSFFLISIRETNKGILSPETFYCLRLRHYCVGAVRVTMALNHGVLLGLRSSNRPSNQARTRRGRRERTSTETDS